MLRQQIRFEWYIDDESQMWSEMSGDMAPPILARKLLADAEYRFSQRLLHSLAVFLVGMLALSSVARTPEELDQIRATRGIQALLAREAAATQEEEAEPVPSLLAVQLVDDVVLAELRVHNSASSWWVSSPFRETRFYRQTEYGWQQTAPPPSIWGSSRSLETRHLRFEYHARDADLVVAVALRVDQIYRDLHLVLGLEPPSSTEKLTSVVTTTPVRGRGVYADRVDVASPLVSQIPEGLSPTDLLIHRLTSRYLYRIFSQVEDLELMSTDSHQWQPLRRGLQSWLQTELTGQRWPSHQAAEDHLRHNIDQQSLPYLSDVTGRSAWQLPVREDLMWRHAVAESVIAYIVDEYGRERLPGLAIGLQRYRPWQVLVPALFGVSVEDFEAGWQQYLLEKYGSQ